MASHNRTEDARARRWAGAVAPLIRRLVDETLTAPMASANRRRQREAMGVLCGPWVDAIESSKQVLTTVQLLAAAALAAARERDVDESGKRSDIRDLLELGGCGTRIDGLLSAAAGLHRSADFTELIRCAELAVPAPPVAESAASTDSEPVRPEDPDPFRPAVPQVYFEALLAEMAPGRKRRLGVFYTPDELVRFLVHRADCMLRERFTLPLGLADSTGWAKFAEDHHLPWADALKDTPVVRIFEPAAGTGAFLLETIRCMYGTLRRQWDAEGLSPVQQKRQWDQFVRSQLPQRIGGCEMAPEALAIFRMNLLIAYHRSGAVSAADEAIIPPLFCGNALDEEVATAIEAAGPWTVVLGNPPWSGLSKHQTPFTDSLLRTAFQSRSGERISGYFEVDGRPLGERKVWLQDDYVKFFRLTQWLHARAGVGVAGLVTNHAFLSNSTFRGMRHSLLTTSPLIDVIDLHGNRRRGFDQADESVFPGVLQGVSLTMMTRPPEATEPQVRYAGLRGAARQKLSRLDQATLDDAELTNSLQAEEESAAPDVASESRLIWQPVAPQSPDYEMLPGESNATADSAGTCITDLFQQKVSGIVTARDAVVLSVTREGLLRRIDDFRGETRTDDELRARWWTKRTRSPYPPGDTRGWKLPTARSALRGDKQWEERAVRCLRRPFDHWWLYLTAEMVDWPRPAVTSQLLHGDNLALVTIRQQSQVGQPWSHVFVSRTPVESCALSNKQKEICYIYPLYRYPHRPAVLSPASAAETGNDSATVRQSNLQSAISQHLADRCGWQLLENGRGDLRTTFGPEDHFHLIYAILHAPAYRKRFNAGLFRRPPRIPFPVDGTLAATLIRQGADLVALHLLEDDYPAASWNNGNRLPGAEGPAPIASPICQWIPGDDPTVRRVAATPDPGTAGTLRVELNDTTMIRDIPEAAWEFRIGAFRPIPRWLQERARAQHDLSEADREQFDRMVTAISETIRIQSEIDVAIMESGGWETAFRALPD